MNQVGVGKPRPATSSVAAHGSAVLLSGTAIVVRQPKDVTVVHDGTTENLTTTTATVGLLLDQLDVKLGSKDDLQVTGSATTTDSALDGAGVVSSTALAVGHSSRPPPMSAFSAAEDRSDVLRRFARRTARRSSCGESRPRLQTKRVALAYETHKKKDASSYVNDVTVVTKGAKGTADVTYALKYVDGDLVTRTEISRVTVTPPVTRVEKVGTKTFRPSRRV